MFYCVLANEEIRDRLRAAVEALRAKVQEFTAVKKTPFKCQVEALCPSVLLADSVEFLHVKVNHK